MACSHEFRAVHHSGTRSLSGVRWIVLHSEEASTARSAAQWFANPDSAGSAHVCLDDKECYRTLPDSYIAWAAPGANTNGLHIEQAGFAAWPRWRWIKRLKTINRAARQAAVWSLKYDVPLRFRTADELRAGEKGVTYHLEVTKAFGGTHTDPGPNYPRRRFFLLARAHRRRLRRK